MIESCWSASALKRPNFSGVLEILKGYIGITTAISDPEHKTLLQQAGLWDVKITPLHKHEKDSDTESSITPGNEAGVKNGL